MFGSCSSKSNKMAINKLTAFHLILLPNEPTAQLKLESAITEKFVFVLLYLATTVTSGLLVWNQSKPIYLRLSEGRIFRSSDGALDFDSKAFFDSVISHVNVITVFSILTGFSDTEYIFSAMTLTLLNRLD